jgi:hypothetical protein
MHFSTKARTLAHLSAWLRNARILPQVRFTVGEYLRDPAATLTAIRAAGWSLMAVRSSALAEDHLAGSMAGRFCSVLNVRPADLEEAVAKVAASMCGESGCEGDEIFVQPMLEGVTIAGVVFGVDPTNAAPYYVVNYDDVSGRTDSVTSGTSNQLRTHYVHHSATQVAEPITGLIELMRELTAAFGTAALDVEFARVRTGEWVLLQVRPLVISADLVDPDSHRAILDVAAARIAQGSHAQPFLCGRQTVYAVMPDWNPAEMIGIRPKPLALSLYRQLITDNIWAYQRHNYGYRNLRSFPLMVDFHGLPYIDVRVSFNSFIPRDLDAGLADKLVNYYLDRLREDPSLHDKVEFDVVFSCYTLDLPERLERLASFGFSDDERRTIEDSLRRLTNRIIDNKTGLWRSDRDKLEILGKRHDELMSADLDRVSRIYWLLEDCKRYGTLPFAGLARAGFIAVQLLQSLVAVGVLDRASYDAFMSGLNTVNSQMSRDVGQLDRANFLRRYGHLRPGTYDLLSPRYDEAPDLYFDWNSAPRSTERSAPFALSLAQMRQIAGLLVEHGLSHDVVGLFDFLQAGIEMREHAKFVFSKNVSDAMVLFRDFGAAHGFGVDDMAHADIRCVYELYSTAADPKTLLAESIEHGKRRHAEARAINLPPVITEAAQVFDFVMPACEPNFVTQRSVLGPVVSHQDSKRLDGAIVAIPSADPGYDWLFAHNIAGLITAYGGANSHMAIRAGELALPAVIGAGEALYRSWSAASRLHIDCANRRVEVVR